MREVDLLVIGAGPAGLTAAIYGVRANLSVVVVEKSTPGGQMTKTAEIENYPGIKKIEGPELAMNMFMHATELGAEYAYGDLQSVVKEGNLFTVKTDGDEYLAKAVVLANGMHARDLGAKGEKELAGRGISWCAVCDGAFFKNQDVAVIGGGNSAVEEAIYLANMCNSVTVVHRRDELRADKAYQDKAKSHDKIKFEYSTTVSSFEEVDGKLGKIVLNDLKTETTKEIAVQGAFIYVGNLPNTEAVREMGITDEAGFIITGDDMQTNVPGLFAAGDVRVKDLRQVATAVNDGAIAGQNASKHIEML